MKYLIFILLLFPTCTFSQNYSENQIQNFLIKNQNNFCDYESIILTENRIVIDSTNCFPKSNFDLIENITNSEKLLTGITKFPFFDESSWIFSHSENDTVFVSITPNNSSIDKNIQDIEMYFDKELTKIYELRGKIYTKLAILEKDCEYISYRAKYVSYNDIFLPDTVAYYTSTDSLLRMIKNDYKFIPTEKQNSNKRCWVTKTDCSNYTIDNDEILLKKFFESKVFEEKNCFLTGEMLDSQKNYDHIGASIDPSISFTYKILKEYKNSNIWKVTLLDSLGSGIDYYVEVKPENHNKKIARIRAFSLPGFYLMMTDSLINSKNEIERKLAEDILLWVSTDDSLISYYKKNQNDFKKLSLQLDAIPKWNRIMRVDDSSSIENTKINLLLGNLRINSVYKEELYPHLIIYNLGGWLDNEVGFIECKNNCKLPEVFKSRFILIEKINNNWYLYKTT